MNELALSDLQIVLPEIWLALAGMALLMVGVFTSNRSTRLITGLTLVVFIIAGVLVNSGLDGTGFGGLVVDDRFGAFMKTLVLIGAGLTLLMSLGFIRREGMERFEFPVLILFATLGMFIMVSANDLMSLYIGLEMQSLALYVCAAFQRDNLRSTEAGLKYFVLGAVASGMLLYGASLVYGFTGTTSFADLAVILSGSDVSIGAIVGLVFIAAGLAFKISAVPFHMWTPDVYEGAPTPVTAFFSVAPKVAAVALLIRVLTGPFGGLFAEWQQIVFLLAVASMLLGAFGAIAQTNIKRLMAYSSIGHVGYILVGLAAGTAEGINGIAIYLAVYLAMSVGTWGCILAMRRQQRMVEDIADLSGLSRSNPGLAAALAIFMFSMAGIPPLAGFFGKFYVFLAAVNAGLYTLAVVGVLTSVVGAFYYIRIVKVMYFDEPGDAFDRPVGRELSWVVGLSAAFTLLFFVYTDPVLDGAAAASQSLGLVTIGEAQSAVLE
ncbi:MAG: NADH-quinone oxidoreductase subunit NuoN [Proteobacteria bacterium]|nr:NADH-quinone oxidoreductase subunit NuoN [Pseudomonadota bacterium]